MLVQAKRTAPVLVLLALIGFLAFASQAAAKAKFKYGVASTEVSTNSAILWTRAPKPGVVGVAILPAKVKNGACDLPEKKGKGALEASKDDDLTVQIEMKG